MDINAWFLNSLDVAGLCWIADGPRDGFTANSMDIQYQESSVNKRQVKGGIYQLMGQVKQAIGKAVGNKGLVQRGRKQEANGKIQSGHGDRKEAIEDSI